MRRTFRLVVPLVGLCLVVMVVPGGLGAWGDPLAKLVQDVEERGIVPLSESSYDEGVEGLPWAEIRSRVAAVEDRPLPVYYGRTLLTKPVSGLRSLLDGTRGLQQALTEEVASEEGEDGMAYVLRPVGDEYRDWTAYISGSETAGGKAILTALKLRRRARVVKFQVYLEGATGKSFPDLTDGDVAGLRGTQAWRWLLRDVFESVTFVFDPELVKLKGRSLIRPGPAFGPMPTLNLVRREDCPGLRKAKTRGDYVVDRDTGRYVVQRTDSMVLMQDLPRLLSIDGAVAGDTLGDVVGHELFHGIMRDLMGTEAPGGADSRSRVGHDAPVVSDEAMAFSEGWAEFFEAWTGAANPALSDGVALGKGGRFLAGRQGPIRTNSYAGEGFETWVSSRATGRVKNGSAQMACEGLVAGLIHAVCIHEGVDDPFGLVFRVLASDRPRRTTDFFQALIRRAPDGRTRRVVALTFLYMTKFATVSGEARNLYEEAYTAELAFKRAAGGGPDGAAVEALRQAYTSARAAYEDFVEPLGARVMAGTLPLDGAVGPEIWLDFEVKRARPVTGTLMSEVSRLNLNTADVAQLEEAGLTADGAARLVAARDGTGYFEDLGQATRVCPSFASLLRQAFERAGGR